MRHIYLRLSTCILLFASIIFSSALAQPAAGPVTPPLNIRNFAIFGGLDTTQSGFFGDSTNFGVYLNGGNVVRGGAVGSYTLVRFGVQNGVYSNIYTGTRASFGTFNNIGGSVTAGINGHRPGPIVYGGQGNRFGTDFPYGLHPGDITSNGNVALSTINTSVDGTVRMTDADTYTGPTPAGGIQQSTGLLPKLPKAPTDLPFVNRSNGSPFIPNATLNPGTYPAMELPGGQTIVFNGPGRYNFNAITSTSPNSNTFVFDFKNNETGLIQIYVHGDVNITKINVSFVNGGDASRVYTEVHGSGNTNNGNSFSILGDPGIDFQSNWEGSVWATSGKIKIGTPNPTGDVAVAVNGCLWSNRMVEFVGWNTVTYKPMPSNTTPGQTSTSPIVPYYPPPADGKVDKVIGSELQSLAENYVPGATAPNNFIYRIDASSNKVLVEVIAKAGEYANLLSILTSQYGLTDIISNGPASLIITGKLPINNLTKLNTDPVSAKIDYCRPLFLPITNAGILSTQGDTAMRSLLVRKGYDLDGQGVKVGVISDSYDRALPNPASTSATSDIGFDLPAGGVQVLLDYPFGAASDEGRAMLQIVHDVAPGSPLAFRTGFISPGDMALGIKQLATTANCNVIVDDVTFITEPFLKDGVVANAVNDVVTTNNVTYFSSAGNFGKKSYEGSFDPMNPPGGFDEAMKAHNFSTSSIPSYLQKVTMAPGNYTIVMQWEDDIYSLGETVSGGAQNDLDIYLVDNEGTILFGFNRINIGGDPLEVLPFTVTGSLPLTANIMVVRAGGATPNLKFKFIVFRGNLAINGGYPGASTIVGQANAINSITVGAVAYDKTSAYGVSPIVDMETYSSEGGTVIAGAERNKPDLTAPTGGNVTVNIGPDYDVDGKPNFFGTSAAAPHAAAVAALIKQGKTKFEAATITPGDMRTLLKNTTEEIGLSGFDHTSGFGLVNADAAMRTFANPKPFIGTLVNITPGAVTGLNPFVVSVRGENFSTNSKILFLGDPLPTVFVNTTELRAFIGTFPGDAYIEVTTPAKSSSGLDGGLSEKRYFFNNKKNVIVKVNDATKKFGESLPAFTTTITVDGLSLAAASLTPSDLKLNNLQFSTSATPTSNVGFYPVGVIVPPAASLLTNTYNYEFQFGSLQVQRLPLVVTPRDTTIRYGVFPDVSFNYSFDRNAMNNVAEVENIIKAQHKKFLADNAVAVVSDYGLNQPDGFPLTNADLSNMSMLTTFQSVKNARNFVVDNGVMTPLVGDLPTNDLGKQRFIVDVAARSIYNYRENHASSPLETSYPGQHQRAMLNAKSLATGAATTQVEGSLPQTMINGQFLAMINGQLQAIVNGQLMAIVNGELTVIESLSILPNGQLQAIVNGGVAVIIPNGQLQAIVNGVIYSIDNPVLNANGQLQVMVNGQLMAIVNGQLQAIVNGQLMPIVNGDLVVTVNGTLQVIINGQLQAIVNGQLMAIVNGELEIVEGIVNTSPLQVLVNGGTVVTISNGQLQAIVNGDIVTVTGFAMVNGQLQAIVNTGETFGIINGQLQAIVNGQLQAIVNSFNLGGVNSNNNTAIIIDEDDITVQHGSVGAMFGINMVTGVQVGTHKIVPGAFTHENFDVTYGLGNLTVTPGVVSVTADNKSRNYAQPNPALTYKVKGVPYGEAVNNIVTGISLSTPALQSSPVASYPINVFGTVVNNPKYIVIKQPGSLKVQKVPLTITAVNKPKVYGAPLPALTYTATGFVNGDDAGDLQAVVLSTPATQASPVGTYPINITDNGETNYSLTLVPGVLTVGKAPLTIKADNKARNYGAANPLLTFTATGLVNGDLPSVLTNVILSTNATPASVTGSYPISIIDAGETNYSLTLLPGTLTVNKAPLTIKADNKSRPYGDPNPVLTYTATGFVNGETYSVLNTIPMGTSAVLTSPVGNYAIVPGNAVQTNYTLILQNGTLAVTKAPITITADNKSKIYGTANPGLTFTATGLKNQETQSVLTAVQLQTTALTSSPVGNYPITITDGGETNYQVTTVNGTLRINKAPLTITADNKSKTYGGANPALTFTATGLTNGDGPGVLTGVSLTTPVTSSTGAGTYPIYINDSGEPNYEVTKVNGTLTVNKAPLTIKAENKSRLYGDANPVFTYTATGFVNGDTKASLNPITMTTPAVLTSNVGSYPIVPANVNQANYTLTLQNGILTVTPSPLLITADLKYINQGSPLPEFTSSKVVLKNNDVISGIQYSASNVNTSVPGVYVNTPSLPSLAAYPNYSISFASGNLYVNPYGPGAKKIKIKLECVEEVPSNPLATRYIAYFSYDNKNNSVYYVPIGEDNKIVSLTPTSYSGEQPEVFEKDYHVFEIPFDGTKLVWYLTTNDKTKKTKEASEASSNSNRCDKKGIVTSGNQQTNVQEGPVVSVLPEYTLWPNPVMDKLLVSLKGSTDLKTEISITDATGKKIMPRNVSRISGTSIQVDVSGMQKGIYFLRVTSKSGSVSLRFVKL